jgi:hypothetical protein
LLHRNSELYGKQTVTWTQSLSSSKLPRIQRKSRRSKERRSSILADLILSRPARFWDTTSRKLLGRKTKQIQGWAVALATLITMLVWDWKLLLATGMGILVMVSVPRLQHSNYHTTLPRLWQRLTGTQRSLAVAAIAGGVATVSTYIAVSVWASTDHSWVILGGIAQGLGTVLVILLLSGQLLHGQRSTSESQLQQGLDNLTHPEPLRRLVALQQLLRCAQVEIARPDARYQQRLILNAMHLLLAQETDGRVRDVALDTLQQLHALQSQSAGRFGSLTSLDLQQP